MTLGSLTWLSGGSIHSKTSSPNHACLSKNFDSMVYFVHIHEAFVFVYDLFIYGLHIHFLFSNVYFFLISLFVFIFAFIFSLCAYTYTVYLICIHLNMGIMFSRVFEIPK